MARLGVCAALLSFGLAAAAVLWVIRLRLPPGEVAAGVRIAGLEVEPRADVGELVEQLALRFEGERIIISVAADPTADDSVLSATLGELGFGVDRELVVARAGSFGRRGTWLARAREIEHLRGSGADLPLAVTFDSERFLSLLSAFKARHDRPSVPARLLAQSRTLAPHVAGRFLDLDGLGDLLWSLARSRASVLGGSPSDPARLAAPFVEVAPRVSAEAAAELQGELQVVAEYSTRFRTRGDQATRAQNIAVAAQRLDGWILLPGDRLSFNDVVGERSAENGFEESWQILEGEMVRGMAAGPARCRAPCTLRRCTRASL